MQTRLIRSRRSLAKWMTAAAVMVIPLYLVLFMQHGVTRAQERGPIGMEMAASQETFTETFFETFTETSPTGMQYPTRTDTEIPEPSETLSETDSPSATRTSSSTRTRTITPTRTKTRTLTTTQTKASTSTPTPTPTGHESPTETLTQQPVTPIPPDPGSCPTIPYPGVPPLSGGRGYFPGSIHVYYFNDIGRTDYLLDNPINWETLTGPSVSNWYLSAVDFNWNGEPPTAGVNGDFWSACFQGYLQIPAAGSYTFYLDNLDDGGVLYVGNLETPVISSWLVQGPHSYQATVPLSEGIVPIRLLYAQGQGNQSSVTLAWSSAGIAKEVIKGATSKYATFTPTPTRTPTRMDTLTETPTPKPIATETETPVPATTDTRTPTDSPAATETETTFQTPSRTSTVTYTPSNTPSSTRTQTATRTRPRNRKATRTPTPTRTPTKTRTGTLPANTRTPATPSRTPIITPTTTLTTVTRTPTPTRTPT